VFKALLEVFPVVAKWLAWLVKDYSVAYWAALEPLEALVEQVDKVDNREGLCLLKVVVD
jgi:hypothetical protein